MIEHRRATRMIDTLLFILLSVLIADCASTSTSPKHTDSKQESPAGRKSVVWSPLGIQRDSDQTPDDGWRAFLRVMRSGDMEEIRGATTTRGYASLLKAVIPPETAAITFKRLGKGWSKWKIRWKRNEKSKTIASANLGPECKEAGIWMRKVGPRWKLDRWLPGD